MTVADNWVIRKCFKKILPICGFIADDVMKLIAAGTDLPGGCGGVRTPPTFHEIL